MSNTSHVNRNDIEKGAYTHKSYSNSAEKWGNSSDPEQSEFDPAIDAISYSSPNELIKNVMLEDDQNVQELIVGIQRLKKHNRQLEHDVMKERRKNKFKDGRPAELKKQIGRIVGMINKLTDDFNAEHLKKKELNHQIQSLELQIDQYSHQLGLDSNKFNLKDKADHLLMENLEKKINSTRNHLLNEQKKQNSLRHDIDGLKEHQQSHDKDYKDLKRDIKQLKKEQFEKSQEIQILELDCNISRRELVKLVDVFAKEKELWSGEMSDLSKATNIEAEGWFDENKDSDRKGYNKNQKGKNTKKAKMDALIGLLNHASRQTATREVMNLELFIRGIMDSADLNSGITNFINNLTKKTATLQTKISKVRKELNQYRTISVNADSLSGVKQAKLLETELSRKENERDALQIELSSNRSLIATISNVVESFALLTGFSYEDIQSILLNSNVSKTNKKDVVKSKSSLVNPHLVDLTVLVEQVLIEKRNQEEAGRVERNVEAKRRNHLKYSNESDSSSQQSLVISNKTNNISKTPTIKRNKKRNSVKSSPLEKR
eukprot:TRINITY_DN1721_c0_g1_i1.p1 TRINITY_DN1721_c0_g1~~TRINITY_DN1721_c0_g1_i1.p1  ORF type:complete len:556 (+),score=163.64 TRINITY_DN1721_c0_g1_i1:30-1670(+)